MVTRWREERWERRGGSVWKRKTPLLFWFNDPLSRKEETHTHTHHTHTPHIHTYTHHTYAEQTGTDISVDTHTLCMETERASLVSWEM